MQTGRRVAVDATSYDTGWTRGELIVDDIHSEVDGLQAAGVRFRNDIVSGPGG